jgi:hypothetical protein
MKLDLAKLTKGAVFMDRDDGVWLVRGHEWDWGVFPTRESATRASKHPKHGRRIANEALARSFAAFVASGQPHGSRANRMFLGYVRSGLTLTLGKVWFVPAEKPYVEVQWKPGYASRANTTSAHSYTKNVETARRILSSLRAREDKTFWRYSQEPHRRKLLRHDPGPPFKG